MQRAARPGRGRAWWAAPAAWLLGALVLAPAAAAAPERTVAQGRLAGVIEDGIEVYRNIPYALAPVGARRWQPPGPAAAWTGVRDASRFGPSCLQPPVSPASVYRDPPAASSEDCLSLNIWAPPRAEAAPVIVWIHGGSLRMGGSAAAMYDGAGFASKGVLFVSINYRLGVLGWLAHPGLSAESANSRSGNYGLLDQIAALRWVRQNIAAFGGDPANVTIMGESAGAFSVVYLLTSPPARGLFARAIAESANLRSLPELRVAANGAPAAETIGADLAHQLGAADVAGLRAMDGQQLTDAATRAGFVAQGTIDGQLLPRQLIDVFDAGAQAPVPLLVGFNSGETRGLMPTLTAEVPAPADYRARVQAQTGALAADYLRRYPATDVADSLRASVRDAIFGWAAVRLARSQSAIAAPAYLYYFDHCDDAARARDLCAFHAAELSWVFGRIGPGVRLPANWPQPQGDAERRLSRQLRDYWTSFAATGRPVAADGPQWPAYGDAAGYLHITATPTAAHDLLPGMFELHEQMVQQRRAAGAPWFRGVLAAPGR